MASDDSVKAERDVGEKNEGRSAMSSSAKMAATALVTARVLSPGVRSVLRQGAVRGLSGVLILGDALVSFARGVGRGIQDINAVAGNESPSAASTVAAAEEAARAAQEAARAAQAAAQAAQEAASAVRKKPGRPRPPAAEGGEGPTG